jgi:hypothetical protein
MLDYVILHLTIILDLIYLFDMDVPHDRSSVVHEDRAAGDVPIHSSCAADMKMDDIDITQQAATY